MQCLRLVQAAEKDGGERVLKPLSIVPGPNLHFGEVIEARGDVKSWVHVPGEPDLFFVTNSVEEIEKKLDAID